MAKRENVQDVLMSMDVGRFNSPGRIDVDEFATEVEASRNPMDMANKYKHLKSVLETYKGIPKNELTKKEIDEINFVRKALLSIQKEEDFQKTSSDCKTALEELQNIIKTIQIPQTEELETEKEELVIIETLKTPEIIVNSADEGNEPDKSETEVEKEKPLKKSSPAYKTITYLKKHGKTIQDLEQKLTELNFYKKEIKGDYGLDLYFAIQDFQLANELKDDGIVGRKTYKALFGTEKTQTKEVSEIYTQEILGNGLDIVKIMENRDIILPNKKKINRYMSVSVKGVDEISLAISDNKLYMFGSENWVEAEMGNPSMIFEDGKIKLKNEKEILEGVDRILNLKLHPKIKRVAISTTDNKINGEIIGAITELKYNEKDWVFTFMHDKLYTWNDNEGTWLETKQTDKLPLKIDENTGEVVPWE